MAEVVVNMVLESLAQLLIEKVELIKGVGDDFKLLVEDDCKLLSEEIKRLKAFLDDAAKYHSDSESKEWDQLKKEAQKMLYIAEDLVDKSQVQLRPHREKNKLLRKLGVGNSGTLRALAVETKSILEKVKQLRLRAFQPKPLQESLEPAEVIPDPVSVLQRMENEYDLPGYHKKNIKLMKTELWFLGTFFLLGSGDLQIKIKSVLKFAEDVFGSDSKFDYFGVLETIESVRTELESIDDLGYNLPDECGIYFETTAPAVTATPLTLEPVVEYIDNVVKNAKDLVIVRLDKKPSVVSNEAQSSTYASAKAKVELVEKELSALRNFVCFLGKICSSEQQDCWQTLLCHADYVATCTAITFYISMGCSLPDKLEEMIQHIKPRVRVFYTDVLRYLKLSGTLVVMPPIEFADGFMQSLQQISMELTESSSLTVHQKESVAEQLNSLRIFLNELPLINDIQDEMKMHFFKRLSRVVIDAALVVYSSGDSNKEDWHQELLLVLETIRSVKIKIYQKIREWVTSHLPKNDKLAFSNQLLSFKEFLSVHSDSLASVKNQLEVVHEELTFFEPSVKSVAEQGNNKLCNELENLVGRVVDKAFEAEYILDSFAIRDAPLTFLTMWLSEIIKEIKLIKTELTKSKEKNMTSASNATNEELVGFGDVRKTIRDQLVGGLKELDVVSIVGMAGSGKTTLARSFINDDIIVSHFDFRAECRVSQEYTREDLLLSILISSNCNEPTEISKRSADELADRLRRILLPKRYLLIIDDVWEVKAWEDLKLCFPDNRKGSRIILTSRRKEVAVHAKCVTEPHYLRSLEEPESWLLLQKRVFGQEICPEELKEVGQNIAKKCNGLPLSIVIVAGLLAKMDKTERCWTRTELCFGETVQDGAKDLVKLSYDDLPYKLKHCFLYFGAFLEDREISVSKLTSLWIAEAFINNDEEKCLEDMAEDYLEDLIGRNLVMVTKRRSTGKIKACRVHDLILDFCKEKAKEDNFLLWLKRDQDANYPHFYSEKPVHRRLSFCSNQDDLSRWRPSCSHARSLLFRELSVNTCSSMGHASIIFSNFKFLRVLDLEFVAVKSFPTEIKHLKYLAVQTPEDSIPSSIENLSNLQTFIVKRNGGQVLLPDTLWKLRKLRNISISDSALFDLRGAQESLDGRLSKLDNLATLSSIYVSNVDNMERIAGRTPNLRKLRCIFADSGRWGENENRFPVFDSLSQLETLKAVFTSIPEIGPSRLNSPMNLKKLTLCKFPLPPVEISTIANLLNLEVLKLQQVVFEGDEWEVRDNGFHQLKFLELENLKLSKWIVSEEAFSCLKKLVLDRCLHLEAIPDCFEELGHLQYIEVKSCSEDVSNSARNIKETRVDNGHKCDVKVFS
ncbi:putative late blight resistance protein homolog R1A-3 [Lycium barbarum]|uniref:putative late blight resistance protein homolog R1A-3 n=1 Tax=Lycium barbarum TaxID=112863 RepID=UPI00293E35CC|nr:putative late blight resistance protein homolog R1A-3 [Lycium barbarum]